MPRRPALLRLLTSFAVAVSSAAAALIATGASPADAVTGITGPDVSSYQHLHGVGINWAAVKRQNRVFAIVKATESGWYVNPWFARDYAGAYKAGLVRGSYHFAVPKYPIVNTAKSQAEFYLRHVGDTRTSNTLPPALDLEITGGLSRAALIEWAQTFLLTVRKESGRTPILYTYPNFWFRTLGDAAALRRYPLWFANYHGTTYPGATRLWQFTSAGTVWGIRGGVDLSRYVASSDEWSALSDGTVDTPWNPAAPGAPVAVHAFPGDGSATVSWLPGDAGTSGITGYHVVVSPGGQSLDVGGLTTRATLPGLTNGTSYTFTVTASNAVGVGTPSAASNVIVPATPTEIALSAPQSVDPGAQFDVHGVLTQGTGSQPVGGASVDVSTRPHGHGAWTPVATVTTDGSGAAAATLTANGSVDVRRSYAGSPGLQPSAAVVTVVVGRTVNAALSATRTRLRHAVTLSGSIAPASGGVTVVRQGFYSGGWHTWAVSRTGASGRFSFRIMPTVRTVDIYRVVARTSDGQTIGVSKVLRLRVV